MQAKSAVLLCLLAASGALASAGIKGGASWAHQEASRATKSHEEPSKTQQLEHIEEQQKLTLVEVPRRVEQQQERLEQLPVQQVQQVQQVQRDDESEVQTSRIEQQQVLEQQPLRIEQARQDVAEPEPYSFGYQSETSSRSESGDARGVVRGFYRINGPDGSRLVEYIADENGFRANVNTNEFGTESRSPANVELHSSQPLAKDLSLRAAESSGLRSGASKGWIEQVGQRVEPERKLPALALPLPLPLPVKGSVAEPAPIVERKTTLAEHRLEQQEEQREQLAPSKTETVRASKSLLGPQPARSANFESASAHRDAIKSSQQLAGKPTSWKGQQAVKSSPLRSLQAPVQSYRRLAPAGGVSFYNPAAHEDSDFDWPHYLH